MSYEITVPTYGDAVGMTGVCEDCKAPAGEPCRRYDGTVRAELHRVRAHGHEARRRGCAAYKRHFQTPWAIR